MFTAGKASHLTLKAQKVEQNNFSLNCIVFEFQRLDDKDYIDPDETAHYRPTVFENQAIVRVVFGALRFNILIQQMCAWLHAAYFKTATILRFGLFSSFSIMVAIFQMEYIFY